MTVKFTKEFDELKSDDFVKFDVHKEHIIGHYQMNGLNRIPNDEAKILSPDFYYFINHIIIGIILRDLCLILINKDHFYNDNYNLTIRQFSEELLGPINLLDFSFNQTTSKEYKSLIKNISYKLIYIIYIFLQVFFNIYIYI